MKEWRREFKDRVEKKDPVIHLVDFPLKTSAHYKGKRVEGSVLFGWLKYPKTHEYNGGKAMKMRYSLYRQLRQLDDCKNDIKREIQDFMWEHQDEIEEGIVDGNDLKVIVSVL